MNLEPSYPHSDASAFSPASPPAVVDGAAGGETARDWLAGPQAQAFSHSLYARHASPAVVQGLGSPYTRVQRSALAMSGLDSGSEEQAADPDNVDAGALRQHLVREGGSGFAPDAHTRTRLGGILGFDAGVARLHHNPIAASAARWLNAHAFAIGRDVFFGAGEYAPHSRAGLGLLAHELTHVGQQTGMYGALVQKYSVAGGDVYERQAQMSAQRALAQARGTAGGSGEGANGVDALQVRRYERAYHVDDAQEESTAGVTGGSSVQARLDRLSARALAQAGRVIAGLHLGHVQLAQVNVAVELDLEHMSDAQAVDAWAEAIVDAVLRAEQRQGQTGSASINNEARTAPQPPVVAVQRQARPGTANSSARHPATQSRQTTTQSRPPATQTPAGQTQRYGYIIRLNFPASLRRAGSSLPAAQVRKALLKAYVQQYSGSSTASTATWRWPDYQDPTPEDWKHGYIDLFHEDDSLRATSQAEQDANKTYRQSLSPAEQGRIDRAARELFRQRTRRSADKSAMDANGDSPDAHLYRSLRGELLRKEHDAQAALNALPLPASLSKQEQDTVRGLLRELIAPRAAHKPPDPNALLVSNVDEATAKLLLEVAHSPRRADLLRLLKGAGRPRPAATPAAPPVSQTLHDKLETALADLDYKDAQKRLQLPPDPHDDADVPRVPVEARPVRGRIVNQTGYLVPNQPARFGFEVDDGRPDVYGVPALAIHWVARPQGSVSKMNWQQEADTNYEPLQGEGWFNHKTFGVTFPRAGNYEIEAFVRHSFFLPAHFTQTVAVVEEAQQSRDLQKDALAGYAGQAGADTPHTFDTGAFDSTFSDYNKGAVTRGSLDPAFQTPGIDTQIKALAEEQKRVTDMLAGYKDQTGDQAESVRKWGDTYLKTLQEAQDTIKKDAGIAGKVALTCRGVYVSRSAQASSSTLNLVCTVLPLSDGQYTVTLHDISQVYERENYRFEATARSVEAAQEAVFVQQAGSYPDGTLALTFQTWDADKRAPGREFVTFRKRTDTVGKDIKNNVFDPGVDIAVNLAGIVLTLFPPTAVAGVVLLTVYNGAKIASDLSDKADKGDLKGSDVAMGVGMLALNLLPFVGQGSKLLTLGGKTFYVLEGVNIAGMAVILSVQARQQIESLRNGVISELAHVDAQIRDLSRTNLADPRLPALKARKQQLVEQGRGAVTQVMTDIAKSQALFLVAGAVAHQAGQARLRGQVERLTSEGAFVHQEGTAPHLDYEQNKIVGDKAKVSPGELAQLERARGQSDALKATVPDALTRQRIVESLSRRDMKRLLDALKRGGLSEAQQARQAGELAELDAQLARHQEAQAQRTLDALERGTSAEHGAPPHKPGAGHEPPAAGQDAPQTGQQGPARRAMSAQDQALTQALPPALRQQAQVSYDGTLRPRQVRVEFTTDAQGLVENLYVRYGPQSRVGDILLHEDVVRDMAGWRGLAGQARGVLADIRLLLGRQTLRPGMQAYNAAQELQKLPRVIASRLRLLQGENIGAEQRAELTREVATYRQRLGRFAEQLSDLGLRGDSIEARPPAPTLPPGATSAQQTAIRSFLSRSGLASGAAPHYQPLADMLEGAEASAPLVAGTGRDPLLLQRGYGAALARIQRLEPALAGSADLRTYLLTHPEQFAEAVSLAERYGSRGVAQMERDGTVGLLALRRERQVQLRVAASRAPVTLRTGRPPIDVADLDQLNRFGFTQHPAVGTTARTASRTFPTTGTATYRMNSNGRFEVESVPISRSGTTTTIHEYDVLDTYAGARKVVTGQPMQAHHGAQNELMQQVFGGYGYEGDEAPTIWMRTTGRRAPHDELTVVQRRLQSGRLAANPTYAQIREWGAADMKAVGVPDRYIAAYLEKMDVYFETHVLPNLRAHGVQHMAGIY